MTTTAKVPRHPGSGLVKQWMDVLAITQYLGNLRNASFMNDIVAYKAKKVESYVLACCTCFNV